jgi:hypothetical protein
MNMSMLCMRVNLSECGLSSCVAYVSEFEAHVYMDCLHRTTPVDVVWPSRLHALEVLHRPM